MPSPARVEPETRYLVSIVIPVYNGAATIEACIRSVLGLDFPSAPLEVVVVDNASTDGTRGVLERYRDRIRIVSEAIRGPAAARNAGIRASRGRLIAFTDADCIVDPTWLQHLLPPLSDDSVGIVGGVILATRPCNRIELFGEKIHDHRMAIEDNAPPYAITMNWASRRETLLQAGGFDETLLRGEDVDLAYRIYEAGLRLVFCEHARIYHRNESDLKGLFREGMAHGRASVMLRTKPKYAAMFADRRSTIGRRVINDTIQVVRGLPGGSRDRLESMCALVFDLGKLVGHVTSRARGAQASNRLLEARPRLGRLDSDG